ncbi:MULTISPECIES: mannitol-1-phosphate 5-dehydrogenase [Paenibacillus]|uniref:Mannitol-1-phosphate 5-dehydrogenase n=1 Tax=Paenibacillus odorifer TaxID=189426 RepID=A0A1R0X2L8_9BACL|nr:MULTISPECIES: mannitol-1-phosphate 5-dehydrogenase [Paenibacillus]ETT45053.1 mannitol dehydrogenase [Paenibacillus sp. FSL H8-237]OMD27281.1 mannitol-1-phosphate 5-dehydrogenase [Paenibacillus odorifer]OME50822.1 mannitol-1-phosphate 5-dehydrogenase [Paenibacillus odorifer]
MRAVHFGAGNIGRGFIGPMLSDSGYNVCFVGRNKSKIAQLQKRGQYPVTLANKNRDSFIVDNVTAINLNDTEDVTRAIAEAEIVTTAVGISALQDIAETIAQGIERRLENSRNLTPLHIIACENGIGSSQKLKKSVYRYMKQSFKELADRNVAFPNAMVDRIVPMQKNTDSLEILVEPFSEWVIPRSGMIGNYNEIKGVHYVDSLAPYLERKLFTVNTGHCSAAYFGYLEGYTSIQEAMSDPEIRARVHGVLKETGTLLVHLYGFKPIEHDRYIEKMMERFTNPNFNDKITRVARSPLRKLSPNDRLVKPAMLAHELGFETSHLVSAIVSALYFDYEKDPEALQLQADIRNHGLSEVIATQLKIPTVHPLHGRIILESNKLRARYPHRTRMKTVNVRVPYF